MSGFRDFRRDVSGNVAMMAAFAAVPLCLGVGAAVDMSHASYARTVLQGAADSAALAGATSKNKSHSALQATVEEYLRANHAEEVLASVTGIEQHYDPGKGTFKVTVNGRIATSFMAVAGMKELDIGASAEVNVGSQALEIALVLDNTGSMAGTKTVNLINAATNLVNTIQQEASGYADVKMAVVPFAEYVNVGVGNEFAGWIDRSSLASQPFSGCVGSRDAPRDMRSGAAGQDYPALPVGVLCNQPLLPLTDDLWAVKAKIATMTATGWTYIPSGLIWGWNVLDSQAPFTEGRSTAQKKLLNGRKAIVLMTDGENTKAPSYPLHDSDDVAAANSNLETLCENVKKDDIEIYTVSFMVPSESIKDILTNCASSPGQYFDADNGTELNAAFQKIARELASARLTQ